MEPQKPTINGSPEPYLRARDLAKLLSITEGSIGVVNTGLRSVRSLDREKERENEKAHRTADDVVAQQGRRNYPWCVLPASDLNCYKEGPKCEHDERKRKRDDSVEHRMRTGDA
jgi:prophage antirepressor-like protein